MSALWVGAVLLCTQAQAGASPDSDSAAAKLYRRACGHVARGRLDLALELLQESFRSGHPHPMQVVADTCFESLLLDPASRAELRTLLRRHAWDSRALMVTSHEPGERIYLEAVVVDTTGAAVTRAVVEFYQADSQGSYSRENDANNPRLIGFLLADDSGRVEVETVRPGACSTADSVVFPALVHFTVSCAGFDTLSGEILFSETGEKSLASSPSSPPNKAPVVARAQAGRDAPFYRVKITLQPGP